MNRRRIVSSRFVRHRQLIELKSTVFSSPLSVQKKTFQFVERKHDRMIAYHKRKHDLISKNEILLKHFIRQ